jgi:hypothetical protein
VKEPNFFIVGAPKCGTTSLSSYLREHPKVFFCSPKEPYYFATDFPIHRSVNNAVNLEQYLDLFAGATTEHLAIGEGSAGYLYSADAIPRIMAFNTNAKLIVMLRNPIDIAHAMHSQALFDGDEDEQDFETAWHLQAERERGEKLPRCCRNPKVVLYKRLASVGEQLERLYRHASKQQVHVVMLDDLIRTPQTVYERVCEHLSIPPDGRTEFAAKNESKRHRFGLLGHIVRQPPRFMVRGARSVKRLFGIQRLGLAEAIERVNVVKWHRPAMSSEFRRLMADEFREDVGKLSAILQTDLSNWLHCERKAA